MEPLSKHQYELLKFLDNSGSIRYSTVPTEDIPDYEYLKSKGLINIKSKTIIDKSLPWPHFYDKRSKIIILPLGQSYIAETRKTTFRFYLPFSVSTVLSLIAIGISIISLIISVLALRYSLIMPH